MSKQGDQKGNAKSTVQVEVVKVDGVRRSNRPDATLARDQQARIGSQLRAMYDGLVSEPIPDRFLELLNQMEEQDGDAAAPQSSDDGKNSRDGA